MSLETRLAIEEFETLAKGIILRGYYKPGGDSGASLRHLLGVSRPALYEYVTDEERVDVSALGYVLMRLPDGIWNVRQITVSSEISREIVEDFLPVETRARRRPTYRTGEQSLVTAFSGGMSDLIDFISALTCYQIESDKMRTKYAAYLAKKEEGSIFSVWSRIETLGGAAAVPPDERNSLLHELSVELKADYAAVKKLDATLKGRLLEFARAVIASHSKDLKVVFSDRFRLIGLHSARARKWSGIVRVAVEKYGFGGRPVYLISSNRHSVVNCLSPHVREAIPHAMAGYGEYAALRESGGGVPGDARSRRESTGGIHYLDTPPGMPFCQLIDTASVEGPLADARIGWPARAGEAIILNMDFAFGEEGFFLLNELCEELGPVLRGVYIMGKAGTLVGARGDIMLPSFFVKQGTGDVYDLGNCLARRDFDGLLEGSSVFEGGPMLTVAGTFLQNEEVLRYFRDNWNALGVEMEGVPYARALAQAVLRGRIGRVRVGIAYYSSDAPLSGDLLSEPLGDTGIAPVYAATIAILRNIITSIREA